MLRNKIRKMVIMSLAVGFTAAGAYIRIPIGPVPITLQTFFVLLSGAILGPWAGGGAMVAYIVLGLMGLPVFASGGGPQYVMSPTFGFLLSFPLASASVGLLLSARKREPGPVMSFAALLFGTFLVYLVGVPYLFGYLKWVQGKEVTLWGIMSVGMIPFLPGDMAKVLIGTGMVAPLKRMAALHRER